MSCFACQQEQYHAGRAMFPDHTCKEARGCRCHVTALEPNDDCPQHSGGPWPPRCGDCGRFLPWSVRRTEVLLGNETSLPHRSD